MFETPQQGYIAVSKYARYLDEKGRRETWPETVQRYFNFASEHIGSRHPQALAGWQEREQEMLESVVSLQCMPSMRLLMTAGEAVKRNNIAAYNCSYVAVGQIRDFSDILLILMHGTGVGFSCERQAISNLPVVPERLDAAPSTLVVEDSKEGWADAFFHLLSHLYRGAVPRVDYDQVRPRGSRLKVFGGRASGPEPLKKLFDFTVSAFLEARGRKLTSIEVHDLVCMVADIVVVGGVRRSALISLSNLSDRRMRDAKAGAWWEKTGYRALANNSAVYTERPDAETFMEEWLALVKSKSGERGIFNREAAQKQAAKWGRRSADVEYGCNPCSEILLRPREFCNLTEVVVRATDTLPDLAHKVRTCTALGVFQSTLTYFPGIDPEYAANCEEERLLGVSLTGVMDHPVLNTVSDQSITWLQHLRSVARSEAEDLAKMFGVNASVAITCNKPSGTVAQLTNAGTGGLHPRYAAHYVRTYRQDNKDPLTQFMKDVGVRHEPSFMKPDSETIFSFVVQSPPDAVMRKDRTAIEQMEHWLMFQRHWCEHKPSITIYVKDEEWVEVGSWVFKHFDEVCGVSFLPYDNGSYQQAPFQEISAEEFAAWPQFEIDWTMLREGDDLTVSSQELACVGGVCSL